MQLQELVYLVIIVVAILEVISRILVGITAEQVVNPIDARISYWE